MEELAQELLEFYYMNKNGTLELKEIKNIMSQIEKD